jgi:hypothetical protein
VRGVVPGIQIKSSPKYECGNILGITGLLLGVVLIFLFMEPIMVIPDGSREDELAFKKK